MTRETRRYVRLYYDDLQRDYHEVWFDPTCLSTYSRLLAGADKAWPSLAELPHAVRRRDVETLVRVGLLNVNDNGLYSLKGYQREREERADRGRVNVSKRPDRTTIEPTVVPTTVPSTVGQSVVLTRAPAGFGAGLVSVASTEGVQGEPPDPAEVYWTLAGRWPSEKVLRWIDELAERFGFEATSRTLAHAFRADTDLGTLMGRVSDSLKAEARALDRKEAAEEKKRLREKRSQPHPTTGPDAELRAALWAKYEAQTKPRSVA